MEPRRTAIKLLGIDIGTGGTRAVLVSESGQVLASATHPHVPFQSPRIGWAEQDPHDWWNACKSAIREVIGISQTHPEEIAALALTGQMHGAVLLDDADRVLRPAIIWCDQRSAAECDYLDERIGNRHIIEFTCNPALPNFTLTKLLWVRANEPEIWKQFRSFLLPKDYVRFRLTGVRAIDVADASGTLLLDVAHRRWSGPMREACDLPEKCLPDLYESPDIVSTITAEAARETGLQPGTPVVAGAGDQAAGAVGMGIVQPGSVSATIGTSGVVFAATDRPALDPAGRLHTFCHAVPGRWHVMGVTQAAGLSLRWFRDAFGANAAGGQDPYEALSAEAAAVPAGAEGLLWAPYLMGERTPHLDPNARGALVGLTASHGRGHIIRAILEGVAFSLRDTFTIFREMGVPVSSIRLGGGGARSPLWRQIQADVYGLPVEVFAAEEGAAYGAAILAGVGIGVWNNVDSACKSVPNVVQRISPDPAAAGVMQEQYEKFRALYPALKSTEEARSAGVSSLAPRESQLQHSK
ncbi:MAG: xylulokinase [Acidobacteriaceae bacterium]